MFETEVRHIWGDKVADYIEVEYVIKPQKVNMSIGAKTIPKAINNHILFMGKHYTLYVSPQILQKPRKDVLATIRHEVIHIGYMRHTKDFFDMCKKYDACLTGESYRNKHLSMYQAQVKKGSRYVTIKRFDDEQESFIWLKHYCQEHKCRGRVKL